VFTRQGQHYAGRILIPEELTALRAAARDRRLARVMIAFSLFALVNFAVWVAVLLYAFARGGAGLAGLVGVAQLVPAAVLAPVFGSFGDRLPRGAALSGAYAAEAATLGAVAVLLLADAPIVVVVTAAAGATTAISVARSIHYAALPQLATTPGALVSANAACGVAEGIGVFVGPVSAGFVAQGYGPWLVTALSALAMLGATLLTARLRLPVSSAGADEAGALRSAAAGLRSVSSDRSVLALLLVVCVVFLVSGSLEVLGVSFANAVLHEGDSTAGLIVGATGIGALIGAAAAAGLAFRGRLAAPTALGLFAAGLPLLVMTAVGSLAPAVALLAVCGLGQAFTLVAGRTLLQRSIDDRVLARVFSVQEGVMMAGVAGGEALAPLLIRRFGAARGYLPLGLILVVIAFMTWPLLRQLDLRASVRADVLAVLRKVPFLAALSPPALERLSQSAQWVEAQAGEVVVRQGDVGEGFYVIAEGRMSVVVDGALRAHRLGQGTGFGEIALLRDVPRTATVTAIEPCRLVRVERADFLAAITGSADGRLIAARVAAAHIDRDARNGF
jgi:MFS family permease